MKSLLAMTTATLLVLGLGGVDAKAHACQYTDMVQSWYHQYLNRQPDPQGLHTWVSALRNGASPADVQASILSSDEYFCQHGHTNTGYVTALYSDMVGRAPCAQELSDWTGRLRHLGCRKRLAQDFCAAVGPVTAHRHIRPVVVASPRYGHAPLHYAAPVVRPAVSVYPPVSSGVRLGVGYTRR